jgi:hypothetical protein
VRAGDEEEGAVEGVGGGGEVLGQVVAELDRRVRVVRDLAQLQVVAKVSLLPGAGELDSLGPFGSSDEELPVPPLFVRVQ